MCFRLPSLPRLASTAGFSLIELMVVVGVIGILASIAGPRYARYVNKARQAEAKLNLSGLYIAEKAFATEYGAYAPCFKATGFLPEGGAISAFSTNPKSFYYLGWDGLTYAGTINGYVGGFANSQMRPYKAPSSWGNCPLSPTSAQAAPYDVNDPQSFEARAWAMLPGNANNTCDMWSIDQNKVVKNINVGP